MPHEFMLASDHGTLTSLATLIFVTLLFVAVAAAYLRGWLQLRSTSPGAIAPWRLGSFLFGLVLVWVATASPAAMLDHELLTIHMLQHLLLMTLAPPLIWLGAPIEPLSRGLPGSVSRSVVDPLFRNKVIQHVAETITQPAFCWLISIAVLAAWHIPDALTLTLHSETWHMLEHASFLAAGLLFWWPVIQPWPSVSKWPDLLIILYLFFATLPCDVLAGFLVFCDRVVYPIYESAAKPFGLSAMEDQQYAAALMWTTVTVVYLVAGAILTTHLLSPQASRRPLRKHAQS